MRVTHVITRLIVGGAQENTVASVLGLQRKPGLEVNLISGPAFGREGSLESLFIKSPQTLTILPELVRPLHPWKDWVARRRLTGLFREQRPHIVHTHSGKAGILGRLAAAEAGVPVIIHTIHGPSFGNFQNPLANCAFRAAERHAAKKTTHFIAVADAMIRHYLAAGIGRPEQYTKILSGFPLEPFLSAGNDPSVRARWGIAPGDIVIGKIARLFKLKGHDDLFAVAPALARSDPRVKFLLVGDGPWRSRFEKRARALGLEKQFIFTGLVAPAEIPALVGIMDILAHLSRREGLPRALPQAMAAGKPIVAYDCDGAREVCLDNQTGFLLRPGDLAGLRQRLTALTGDAGLRERLGKAGRELVRERFPVERMVDDLYALYLKLFAGTVNREISC
jgi:glycosyltransferase involved in cell wall biosynthesis